MKNALLLNASWEPLHVIPMKRAIILILAEKAEIVHPGTEEWHSATQSIPVPSVLRLTHFVKVPFRARIPLNRKAILTRDKGLCQYCFKSGDTIDHVIPRSRGGTHTWTNVVTACRKCNAKKDDKTLKELRWELARAPYAPKGNFWLVIGLTVVDEAWAPYLGLQAA